MGAIFSSYVIGYQDVNEDGRIESNEIAVSDSAIYLGHQDPTAQMNFGTSVALWGGRLTLSANGDYQRGALVNNEAGVFQALVSQSYTADGLGPAALVVASHLPGGIVSGWKYQAVNTFRLDGLSVNYMLPAAFACMLRSHTASVMLQGRNLLLLSNYHGKDPNVNSIIGGFGQTDSGVLPSPRTWQLGVSLIQ
jgi:hypothetical protein